MASGRGAPSTSPSDVRPTSITALCSRYSLTVADFNAEVSKDHILEIYSQLDKWEEVATHLGFSKADLQSIKRYSVRDESLIKLNMLQQWKSRGKLSGTSTYRCLIEALLKCKCLNTIEQVCLLLQQK